jgi:hypothetical protein
VLFSLNDRTFIHLTDLYREKNAAEVEAFTTKREDVVKNSGDLEVR